MSINEIRVKEMIEKCLTDGLGVCIPSKENPTMYGGIYGDLLDIPIMLEYNNNGKFEPINIENVNLNKEKEQQYKYIEDDIEYTFKGIISDLKQKENGYTLFLIKKLNK